MSAKRSAWMATLLSMFTAGVVSANQQSLSLPGYPGMHASIDLNPQFCSATLPLRIYARHESDLGDGSAARKAMAWARVVAQMECPQATAIDLVALVDGRRVYAATASKANGWVIVESPPAKKRQTAKAPVQPQAKAPGMAISASACYFRHAVRQNGAFAFGGRNRCFHVGREPANK